MKKITKSKPVSAPGGGPLDIFKREMEQLRNDFQARNAAVNAAYGEILNSINRVYRAVDSAVLKEREDTEKKDMMDMMKAYNEDCRRSVSEVTEAETYRVGCQYPDVFIAQSLASDNDQDRFQRQDNSIWEVENDEFKKSIRSRRPRLTMLAVIAQPLASDNVYRTGELIPGNSQRRPPSVVCARRGPARRAPAIRTNAQKIGNRQDRDKPRPAPPTSAPTQSRTRRRPRSSQSGARPSTDTGRTCRPTRGRPFRDDRMQGLAWRRSPRRDPAPATRANAQQIGNRQYGARPSTDTRRTRRPNRGRPYKDDLGLTNLEGTLMGFEWKILV